MSLFLIPFFTAFLAIFTAVFLYFSLKKTKVKNEKMTDVAAPIALGVKTYLIRQLKTILLITPFLAAVIYFALSPLISLTFVLGVFTSLATAFLGMNAAVKANVRTADQATTSPQKAFQTAVFGGGVMGFAVTGFSLLTLTLLYYLIRNPEPLVGFGFGASLAALFAQIGGGIYTKSADIGADLVGKIEKNIPEDDPRNPGVIADLVGDNVGDCAGRGSDLFQTFSGDIITGMLVSLIYFKKYGPQVIFFPLLLQSVSLLSSLISVFSIKFFKKQKPETAFNLGMVLNMFLAAIGSYFLSQYLLNDLTIFIGCVLGILTTFISTSFTKYYAGVNGQPVKNIAEASKRGPAINLITGLASGLQSPIGSIVMIVSAATLAFFLSGGSLLAVVAVNIGTDLLIGYIMTADVFGPITDNASGIAEMSGASERVVNSLSALDSVGNTMKAVTKAYAMSSGTITSFVLFATFFSMIGLKTLEVSTPYSLGFLFLGISLPYLISSLVIGSTAKTAMKMVDEVRRQFREIKGLIEGEVKPDYAACVDISTKNALKEMFLPGLISITIPLVIGLLFGGYAVGALLIGAVASAALLGPFFNNMGTAQDNAKKLIEGRGEKGTFAHQAAVIGDTVGDPMKDVAGPSLLIFMKLIGMAALLIANVIK